MAVNENKFNVDGFRMIGGLHTTVRQLSVLDEIVSQLNIRQLPEKFLGQLLFGWSAKKEIESQEYNKANGKLTNNGKKSTALPHYLDFCHSLGLLSHLNGFYANNRIAFVLLYFSRKKKIENEELSGAGKAFFLSQFLALDADGILLVLQMISGEPINQKGIQSQFKTELNHRLVAKQEHASSIVKSEIGERYRTLNFQWQNAESYAEHILIPRCEWLHQLGIVEIQKVKGATFYSLSEVGRKFYNFLPDVISQGYIFKDINEKWIKESMFDSFDVLFSASRIKYSNLPVYLGNEVLGELLLRASDVVKSSNTFRLPLYDTMLFICLEMFTEKSYIINFDEILNKLNSLFSYHGRQFLSKEAGRVNEGYINIIV